MLKKLISIFVVLFCTTLIWADVDEFIGVSTVDEYLGISTIDEVVGQTVAAAGGNGYDKTDANLLGLWYFEQDLTDESGQGNTLSANGTVSYHASSPAPGTTNDSQSYSMLLETANAESVENNSTDLDPADDMSFGCWVYPVDDAIEMHLMAKHGSSSGDYGWRMYLQGDDVDNAITIRFTVDGTNLTRYETSTTDLWSVNTWTHLVIVFDGTGEDNVRLYQDGSEVTDGQFPGANTGTVYNSTDPFSIGDYGTSPAEWDGNVDECFYFDKALTDADVTKIYTYGFE